MRTAAPPTGTAVPRGGGGDLPEDDEQKAGRTLVIPSLPLALDAATGSRFVTSDGVSLWYELRGSGPPLYVCHGGPGSTYSYLVAALRPLEREYTLVYHDYRGSGRSGRASARTYTFARLAEDLEELRQQLGHRRVALLAHSLGGFVALRYATRYPRPVERLALVSVAPCASARTLFWPTMRALGPERALRLLAGTVRYLLAWSWRRESPARREARWALVATLLGSWPGRT